MKRCLRLAATLFFLLFWKMAFATTPFFNEAPIRVHSPCLEGQVFVLKVPVRVPAGVQVHYRWYRDGALITGAGGQGTLNATGSGDTIRYTVPAEEAVGVDVTFHFAYTLTDGCTEWTPGRQYAVWFINFNFGTEGCIANGGAIRAIGAPCRNCEDITLPTPCLISSDNSTLLAWPQPRGVCFDQHGGGSVAATPVIPAGRALLGIITNIFN